MDGNDAEAALKLHLEVEDGPMATAVKKKNKHQERRTGYQTREKLVYENCHVHGPDGRLMFRCGRKKVEWYLDKGLAVPFGHESADGVGVGGRTGNDNRLLGALTSIMLRFEPAGPGRSRPDDEFYLEDQYNVCVGCGRGPDAEPCGGATGETAEGLIVHHVIPSQYKRNFPVEVKAHSSHDCLPLCGACKAAYEPHAHDLRLELAQRYDAPLPGKGWVRRPGALQAKSAAGALLRHRAVIPPERLAELWETVVRYVQDNPDTLSAELEYWEPHADEPSVKRRRVNQGDVISPGEDGAPLSDAALRVLTETPYVTKGPDFVDHGEIVAAQVLRACANQDSPEPIIEFVRLWREHFLFHVKPRFLSSTWKVTNPAYNEY